MCKKLLVLFFALFMLSSCVSKQETNTPKQPQTAIQTEVASANSKTLPSAVRSEEATSLPPTSSATIASGRLIYTTGDIGNQTLWFRDLAQKEPFPLITGTEVFGWGNKNFKNILYSSSSSEGGLKTFYQADDQGKNAILLASNVDDARGIKSIDGKKLLVSSTTAGKTRLELIDLESGKKDTLVQTADQIDARFINGGRTVVFNVVIEGKSSLYCVDSDFQSLPRELSSGERINLFYSYAEHIVVWITYRGDKASLFTYNTQNSEIQELLRGRHFNYAVLKDKSISLILIYEDGSQEYYILTKAGLSQTSGQLTNVSPDQNFVIYRKDSSLFLGKPGGKNLQKLINEDFVPHFAKFTTDSKYVLYMGYKVDQTQVAIFSVSTAIGKENELARFTAPSNSSDQSRGITTYSYPAGYGVRTSNKTATGGFSVSPDGTAVLVYWSWLTGDQAGSHQLLLMNADGSNQKVLSEGKGILPATPQFAPDSRTVFATTEIDGVQELKIYSQNNNPTILVSDATAISFQFTADKRSAILGVSANIGGNRIYLVDLATLSTSKIADGTAPLLIDAFEE